MGKNFGEYLKKLRDERKMSLYDVEREAKISNAYLSQVERGIRNVPSIKILSRLAKTYGVSVDLLTSKAFELDFLPKQSKEAFDIPAPDINFICRRYKKLSEENKKLLKKFLNILQNEDNDKK